MNTLKLEMENCYGIQKIQQDIDFSKNNVAVIYAPNGTMKSSFAKTFEAIRDGKTVEEKVYGCKSKYSITDETSTAISPESIMVINPFDENAYENQGTLMANETLRRQYIQIYKSIDQSREAMFGKIKASLKYSSRSSFDAAIIVTWYRNWQQEASIKSTGFSLILEYLPISLTMKNAVLPTG